MGTEFEGRLSAGRMDLLGGVWPLLEPRLVLLLLLKGAISGPRKAVAAENVSRGNEVKEKGPAWPAGGFDS